MGYLVMRLPQGDFFLGDEDAINAYRRDQGLPHTAKDGRRITEDDIRREENSGLGA